MEKIIDGKAIAADIREEIAADVVALKKQGVTPGLAVVLMGDDPASRVYVTMKEKAVKKQVSSLMSINSPQRQQKHNCWR